jgi:hypothetical protein
MPSVPIITYNLTSSNLRVNINNLNKTQHSGDRMSELYDIEHNKYLKELYLNSSINRYYPIKYQCLNMENYDYH